MSPVRDDEPDDHGDAPRDRHLGILGGVGWGAVAWLVMSATTGLLLLVSGRENDLVGFTLCSALAFSACAYAMMRFYLPSRSLGDALGARPVSPLAYVLGALVGVALLVPATWLDDLVVARFPYTEAERAFFEQAFTFASRGHKLAFAVAAIAIGPAFEDLLFRGVLYRAVRRTEPARLAILASALAFTFAHANHVRALPDVLLGGLVLGVLREVSGSVWVSLAAHVAYNAVPVVAQLAAWLPSTPDPANLSKTVVALGALATAVLVGLVVVLGRFSATIRAARAADAR